jgi:DNA-binding transcriptional MerR regulator
LTIEDKVKETERKPTIKQIQRRNRTLELRCKGLTIPQINKALHDEHYATSEHTVFDDIHSQTADDFLEELKRQQLIDITKANEDYKTRLQYRGQMIEILSPKQNINKNEQIGKIVVEVVDPPDPKSKNPV